MKISKLKAILTYLSGGVAGLVEYILTLFNEQVLAKCDPAQLAKYAKDVQDVLLALNSIFDNHKDDLGEAKKAALAATINAVDELAKALVDAKVEPAELDAIVDKVTAAIKAWQEAK